MRLSRTIFTLLTTKQRRGIVHLNHAGASPCSDKTLEIITKHLRLEQQLGGYAAAEHSPEVSSHPYEAISNLLQCRPHEIALVESATVAWTRLFYSMVKAVTSRQRVILVSEIDYAANIVAACDYAASHNWTVLCIPSLKNTGKVDLEALQSMLEGTYHYGDTVLDPATIALVCVTHVPTNSGIINKVGEIGKIICKYNKNHEISPILYLVDACQSIGQMPVHVNELHCHGLAATGRKYLRGPRGTGFLYVSDTIVDRLLPDHVDHYCMPIARVPSPQYILEQPIQKIVDYRPLPGAKRFEFWESNVAGRLGLANAVQEAMDQNLEWIARTVRNLAVELHDKLERIERVQLFYRPESGIVTFSLKDMESSEVKDLLWEAGLEVSVVPATSTPLNSARSGVPNLIRASVSYTTTSFDIDAFVDEIQAISQR